MPLWMRFLRCISRCASETKPSDNGMLNSWRYNFVSIWWFQFAKLFSQEIPLFLTTLLPADKQQYVEELGPYLANSFGNEVRIDYGTGHETFLVIFLYCLHRIGVIDDASLRAVVLSCFAAYVKTVRKLQSVYVLEPAGSHGVWGLDDYHCLVFLWGAAQVQSCIYISVL